MESAKADFTKIVQKQWQEDQLREEIARLIDTIKDKEKQISELTQKLDETTLKAKQFEKEVNAALAEKEKIIKEKSVQMVEKDEIINNLKREISGLRIALEKEKNKTLIDRIFKKEK